MIAGQERDRDGGGAEQEQRRDQLGRLAVFAVDRHENDGADRPGHEGQRKDHEGIEGAGQFAREREHQARKDDHRGDREDEEVEEFRGAADDDADGNLAGTSLVVAVLARVEVCHCGDLCRRHWCALNVLKTQSRPPGGAPGDPVLFGATFRTATLDKLSNVRIAASQLPLGLTKETHSHKVGPCPVSRSWRCYPWRFR
ncbi:hypothetical protein ACVWW2_000469 [Bradyrhizobium sp. LM4.3]